MVFLMKRCPIVFDLALPPGSIFGWPMATGIERARTILIMKQKEKKKGEKNKALHPTPKQSTGFLQRKLKGPFIAVSITDCAILFYFPVHGPMPIDTMIMKRFIAGMAKGRL